jgi:hypothetical protein
LSKRHAAEPAAYDNYPSRTHDLIFSLSFTTRFGKLPVWPSEGAAPVRIFERGALAAPHRLAKCVPNRAIIAIRRHVVATSSDLRRASSTTGSWRIER